MNKLDNPVNPQEIKQSGMQVSNVMADEFGIDIPAEAVPLPSRGVIYSSGGALYGKETIDIKPMTAREEDILTSRAYIKNGTVISKLIESCLIDKSINTEDLISGDRNALMIALRITGYGSEYSADVSCPECGKSSKCDFDLSQLPIKRLQIDPVEVGQNVFEVQLPVTKKNIKVKFLTGHDEREMLLTSERKKKHGLSQDSAVTDRLKQSILSIDDITDKNKINFFVNNMPARDSLALRRFLDSNEPGVDMKAHMQCSHCFEESEVDLPLGPTFFWPDA